MCIMGLFCFTCEKAFSRQSSLNRHNRNVHKKYTYYIGFACPKSYVCNECKVYFNFNRDLRSHLKEKHNYSTELVNLQFKNFSDFTTWMAQEERENNIQYCKVRGVNRRSESERYYYECVRSSRKYILRQDRKRELKSQGSCKMLYSCTSQIIVEKNIKTDNCHVSYFKTHYGHGQDIEHLHLSKDDKDSIASRLMLGVPPKRILDDVRESISEDLKRVDLLTGEDIRNIKTSYGIDLKDGQEDDATSVHSWASECLSSGESPTVLLNNQQDRVAMQDTELQQECASLSGPEDVSGEIQELVSDVSHKSNTNKLKDQIWTRVHSILDSIDGDELSDEQLESILHHLDTASGISNISVCKFITDDSKVVKEPGNKNVKERSVFKTKKQKNNSVRALQKKKSTIKEILNNDIIISCSAENDHQYE